MNHRYLCSSIAHLRLSGSFSLIVFRTLISNRAASRYLSTFLIIFSAKRVLPSLVADRKRNSERYISPRYQLDAYPRRSRTSTTLPKVPSPRVRRTSSANKRPTEKVRFSFVSLGTRKYTMEMLTALFFRDSQSREFNAH